MWGRDDHFGRWVQGLCAVPLVAIAAFCFLIDTPNDYSSRGTGIAGIACLFLAIRCLWYALSGRGNVNSDDF